MANVDLNTSIEDRTRLEAEKEKALLNLKKKAVRTEVKKQYTYDTANAQEQKLIRLQRMQEARNKGTQIRNLKQAQFNATRTGQAVNKAKRFLTSNAKETARRRGAVLKLAGALGVPGQSTRTGAGRPQGTYKYGMPIRQYQKLLNQKRMMAQIQADNYAQEMIKKGYTPEQVQQMKIQKQIQSQENPNFNEEEYQQTLQEATISPNTLAMLQHLREVQNKAQVDDANMQRILRERKMISQQGELLKARNIFKAIPGQMEGWLERPETNPLRAPNIFKEDRVKNPNIMDTQGRPTILQSVQRLNFFGDPTIQKNQPTKPVRLNFWKS